jgi:hypothetical protein
MRLIRPGKRTRAQTSDPLIKSQQVYCASRTHAAPDLRVIQVLFCELNGPTEIILVLNGYGGESVSQSPLMQRLFFTPTAGNPRSELLEDVRFRWQNRRRAGPR